MDEMQEDSYPARDCWQKKCQACQVCPGRRAHPQIVDGLAPLAQYLPEASCHQRALPAPAVRRGGVFLLRLLRHWNVASCCSELPVSYMPDLEDFEVRTPIGMF